MPPEPTDHAHDDARDGVAADGSGDASDGTVVVDSRGKACPMPVIDLAAAVAANDVGTAFTLLADDAAAKVDVPVWCRMQHQRLDDVHELDDHLAFTVTKVRAAD